MRYLTREGVDVTKRIEKGLTKRFGLMQKKEAVAYAKQERSYVYDLMRETKREAPKHYGYAVPK